MMLGPTILRAPQSTSGLPSPSAAGYANDATLTATIKVMMIAEAMGVVNITNPVMYGELEASSLP